MSYIRGGLGDPITSPTQVDDSVPGPIVGEVAPKRVSCEELAPDSPWRQPGQVCGPPAGGGILEYFSNLIDKIKSSAADVPATPAATPPAPSEESSLPTVLLIGGAAYAAYYLMKKRKKG